MPEQSEEQQNQDEQQQQQQQQGQNPSRSQNENAVCAEHDCSDAEHSVPVIIDEEENEDQGRRRRCHGVVHHHHHHDRRQLPFSYDSIDTAIPLFAEEALVLPSRHRRHYLQNQNHPGHHPLSTPDENNLLHVPGLNYTTNHAGGSVSFSGCNYTDDANIRSSSAGDETISGSSNHRVRFRSTSLQRSIPRPHPPQPDEDPKLWWWKYGDSMQEQQEQFFNDDLNQDFKKQAQQNYSDSLTSTATLNPQAGQPIPSESRNTGSFRANSIVPTRTNSSRLLLVPYGMDSRDQQYNHYEWDDEMLSNRRRNNNNRDLEEYDDNDDDDEVFNSVEPIALRRMNNISRQTTPGAISVDGGIETRRTPSLTLPALLGGVAGTAISLSSSASPMAGGGGGANNSHGTISTTNTITPQISEWEFRLLHPQPRSRTDSSTSQVTINTEVLRWIAGSTDGTTDSTISDDDNRTGEATTSGSEAGLDQDRVSSTARLNVMAGHTNEDVSDDHDVHQMDHHRRRRRRGREDTLQGQQHRHYRQRNRGRRDRILQRWQMLRAYASTHYPHASSHMSMSAAAADVAAAPPQVLEAQLVDESANDDREDELRRIMEENDTLRRQLITLRGGWSSPLSTAVIVEPTSDAVLFAANEPDVACVHDNDDQDDEDAENDNDDDDDVMCWGRGQPYLNSLLAQSAQSTQYYHNDPHGQVALYREGRRLRIRRRRRQFFFGTACGALLLGMLLGFLLRGGGSNKKMLVQPTKPKNDGSRPGGQGAGTGGDNGNGSGGNIFIPPGGSASAPPKETNPPAMGPISLIEQPTLNPHGVFDGVPTMPPFATSPPPHSTSGPQGGQDYTAAPGGKATLEPIRATLEPTRVNPPFESSPPYPYTGGPTAATPTASPQAGAHSTPGPSVTYDSHRPSYSQQSRAPFSYPGTTGKPIMRSTASPTLGLPVVGVRTPSPAGSSESPASVAPPTMAPISKFPEVWPPTVAPSMGLRPRDQIQPTKAPVSDSGVSPDSDGYPTSIPAQWPISKPGGQSTDPPTKKPAVPSTPIAQPTLLPISNQSKPTQQPQAVPNLPPTQRPTVQPQPAANPTPSTQPPVLPSTPSTKPTPRPTALFPSHTIITVAPAPVHPIPTRLPSPTLLPMSRPTTKPSLRATRPPTRSPIQLPPKDRPTASPTTTLLTPDGFQYFSQPEELYVGVDAYIQDDSIDSEVARTYGYPINTWDVSRVSDFSHVFSTRRNPANAFFNEDIGDWKTSSAKTMFNMFAGAKSFDQDISRWDVSNVRWMGGMFRGASVFDRDLNNWNVAKVRDMSNMFLGATLFNGQITNWDVSSVLSFQRMFQNTLRFNQPLTWSVEKCLSFANMFTGALRFNQDLSEWFISEGRNFDNMFNGAILFGRDLCHWNRRIRLDAVVDGMFNHTACSSERKPDLHASPPGPFCVPCLLTGDHGPGEDESAAPSELTFEPEWNGTTNVPDISTTLDPSAPRYTRSPSAVSAKTLLPAAPRRTWRPSLIASLSPSTQEPTATLVAAPTTKSPTESPTIAPTLRHPTETPATRSPTTHPTDTPSRPAPTPRPTTRRPTPTPTVGPTTVSPTLNPTAPPSTLQPSIPPTDAVR